MTRPTSAFRPLACAHWTGIFGSILALWTVGGCAGGVPGAQHGPAGTAASNATAPSARGSGSTSASASICDFHEPVEPGPAGPDGYFVVPPAHPLLRYVGRFACDPKGPTSAWPATQVHAAFVGDGVDVILSDHGDGSMTATGSYAAWIDDRAPILVETVPSQRVYVVARGLGPGVHHLQLWKRGESTLGGHIGTGKSTFLGLRLPAGGHLEPTRPNTRRMEFIGDSITAGYGNNCRTLEPSRHNYTTRGSDASMSHGAILARRLQVDYVATAYSGRGITRNYGGQAGDVLPTMYLRTFPDEPSATPWDVNRYVPDLVVINLGSNDFSPPHGPERATFRRQYLAFVSRLRSYYPRAALWIALGPVLRDPSPWGSPALSEAREDLRWVVEAQRATGDRQVRMLEFPTQRPPYGEDWHPTIATHLEMADQLEPLVRTLFGLPPGQALAQSSEPKLLPGD